MGANFNGDDKDNDMKTNIELMVELQNVRKDLEDKQDLLCQAAKAMEIEEEERKKEIEIRDNQIQELELDLSSLRAQLQKSTTKETVASPEKCGTSEMVRHLQCTIRDLQSEVCFEH